MLPMLFKLGLATTLPFEAALYQITTWPAGTVAVAVRLVIGLGAQLATD